jgi:negative regulator of flagellin synthesis FlgM
MKIENGTNLTRAQLENIRPAEQAKAAAAPPPAAAQESGKDKAEFSEKSLALSKARGALEAVPTVRTDRVDALREEIKTGAYQVPYDKLAGKLLDKLM